jgi:hypothetical protein
MRFDFLTAMSKDGCLLVCSAINTYQNARCYISEDSHLHLGKCLPNAGLL